MTILFVGSSQDEIGGHLVEDTAAGYFDPNFTDRSLKVYLDGPDQKVFTIRHEEPTSTVTWFHFNCFIEVPTQTNLSGEDGWWFSCLDINGNTLFEWQLENGIHYLRVYGDSTQDSPSVGFPRGSLYKFDVKVTVGSDITVEYYLDGNLQTSVTAANSGGKGKPVQWTFFHDDMVGSYSDNYYFPLYYSEFIVTDNESTIGWRLSSLTPNSQGFHDGWQGGVAEIQQGYDGLLIGSNTAGQKESWNLTAYNGPTSVSSIRAVINKFTANAGETGPTQITPFTRIGGTDYDSTVFTPNGNHLDVLDLNPATGLAWDTADLSTLEVGVKSTA